MQNKFYISIIAIIVSSVIGCVNPTEKKDYSNNELLFKSDSLLSLYPDDTELLRSIVSRKIKYADKKDDVMLYKEVLKIDPKNPTANYRLLIDEGMRNHKKDYKNGQWDAIQCFSKAATYIDTLGEPYYWIGKAYEKKDEMDFELPLESYNKSLELYLNEDMRTKASQAIKALKKRKKTYEDFWK